MVERLRALELAGTLAVAYPGRNVTEEHARSWADELEALGDAESSRVVRLLRERCSDPPSVAQVQQTIHEVCQRTMSPPLPLESRTDYLAPEEISQKVRELVASWKEPEQDLERDIEAEDADWQRRMAAVLAGVRMTGVCDGAGKHPVHRDGRLVCPDCGVEVT